MDIPVRYFTWLNVYRYRYDCLERMHGRCKQTSHGSLVIVILPPE